MNSKPECGIKNKLDKEKPRLLVISAVLPFPLRSGQQMRVHNKLIALRDKFHISFLSFAPHESITDLHEPLLELVDDLILLPMRSRKNLFSQYWFRGLTLVWSLFSGLRQSNHLVGDVELNPKRIRACIQPRQYDLVLFEYWHTHATTALFQEYQIPCALDLHDICWRVVKQRLARLPIPDMVRRWRIAQYRREEERAWAKYDLLVTINSAETQYVQKKIPTKTAVYLPMGVDISKWPYSWSPARPPRIAFYGSLGSLGNQQGVFWCLHRIMPLIWTECPEAEFFIVGNNPPAEITELNSRPNVHVTGFVKDIRPFLASMSLMLCPWRGQFGFRSRIIEVMALGLPVVATPDAVFGMEIENGAGLFLHDSDEALARQCLDLLQTSEYLAEQSCLARRQVEQSFTFNKTYERFASTLLAMLGEPAENREEYRS